MKQSLIKTREVTLLFLFSSILSYAQEVNVTGNAALFIGNEYTFTTSDQNINVAPDATLLLEAETDINEPTAYINGRARVTGSGVTQIPVGDVLASPITIKTNAGDLIELDYTLSAPTGSLDPALVTDNFFLSDTEFWEVTSISGPSIDVDVSNLNPLPAATYGGNPAAGDLIVVRFNTTTNQWENYEFSEGFGLFAYAADQTTLGTQIPELDWDTIALFPNPLKAQQQLQYQLPTGVERLHLFIYDASGKLVRQYPSVATEAGVHSLNNPQLASGVYMVVFSVANQSQQIQRRLIVE